MGLYNTTATVWEVNGVSAAGDVTFTSASPRQIQVRWEEASEVDYSTQTTTPGARSQAEHTIYVQEDIPEGSWIYKGTSNASDPTTLSGARKVISFQKTPNLRGTEYTRKVLA